MGRVLLCLWRLRGGKVQKQQEQEGDWEVLRQGQGRLVVVVLVLVVERVRGWCVPWTAWPLSRLL
jgi:hypothetical protein